MIEQDALPTLGDTEQFRHAMWTPPEPGETNHPHVFALRAEIAKRLIPLDGRRNVDMLIGWLAEVHDESQHRKAADSVWLIGDMTWRRHIWCDRLTRQAENERRPDKRAQLVSQREAMKRIHEGLVEAIIKSHAC